MHDWAAVNGWSRPETKSGYGRFSVNIPVKTPLPTRSGFIPYSKSNISPSFITPLPPRSGLRRCHTTLLGQATFTERNQVYKPKKQYSESNTISYIRYLEFTNKESQTKIKNGAIHMLSMQRSKSDLDTRDTPRSLNSPNFMGGGIFKEKSPFFFNSTGSDVARKDSGTSTVNKQEMRIGVAMVPRKGLISLATNDNQQPQMQVANDNRRQLPVGGQEHGSGSSKRRSKSIIKRNDILDHLKAGAKLLEESEEQKHHEEEMSKNLGDYTMVDLQSKIFEMTDAKSLRRPVHQADSPLSDQIHQKPADKTFTLPAIKQFNPFAAVK